MITARSSSSSDKQQPTHWKLNLDCRHFPILKEDQIHKVRSQFNAATGEEDNFVVCPLCAKGAPGSCDRAAIHKVVNWTPMFSRQYNQAQDKFKSASSEKEEEDKKIPAQRAVDHWFEIYQNVPEAHKPAFRKSMELSRKKPELFTRLFATSDANHVVKESDDILAWLREEVQRLEGSK